MIFAAEGHIDMIRNGLSRIEPCKPIIIKTETRRINRSYYQVESERKKPHEIGYAVQRKRGAKGEPDIRIVMDRIWEESCMTYGIGVYPIVLDISEENAWSEGGYTPEQYEKVFRKLNPKWDGWSRWAFKFHVIENKNPKEKKQKLEGSLKHLHQEITEHIHPYVAIKIEKVRK